MTIALLTPLDCDVPARGGLRPWRARALENCDECPIRSFSICSALDRDGFGALQAIGQEVTFRSRALLFMEGEPAEAVFNVTAGLVRLFRLFADGRRQVVGFALPGDFLGLPPDDRHMFSADAAGLTTACRFGRQTFSELVAEHPDLLRRVHDSAVRALDLAHDQMMLLGHRRAEAKIAAFLVGLRERWARICGSSVLVPLPMGRQDIGDFLGLSIATVSRTLTRFARERVILIVPSGVRILDLARLRQVADG
jgi:CRP/FNR family transcriptional regulator